MLDLHSIGSIPRRIAALVFFAGPALALWGTLPAYDGGPGGREALMEIPGFRSFEDFSRDGPFVAEVAGRYQQVLASASSPERRAEQMRKLYGLYALESYVVNMDLTAGTRWQEGAIFRAVALKLGVMKNLLFGLVWQTLGGPPDFALHAGVGAIFLLSGFWLFRLTRHA
jgi:hypothetical protein